MKHPYLAPFRNGVWVEVACIKCGLPKEAAIHSDEERDAEQSSQSTHV